jgi:hypothetical protein
MPDLPLDSNVGRDGAGMAALRRTATFSPTNLLTIPARHDFRARCYF